MQITTYGRTSAPVEVLTPPPTTDPTAPTNPSNPTTPTAPTPPPVDPAQPTVPPNPTTTLPSALANMPVLMDMMHPSIITVLQTAVYNRVRKEYYITQRTDGSNGKVEPYDSTNISRMDNDGKQLDTMRIMDSGHGTSIVVENYGKNNIVYIWLSFANQGNTYYRFLYKKGVYKFGDLVSKTKIPKFTSLYATYHVDWEADVLMERINNSDNTMTLNKRKISEVIKNVNHVYATIRTEPVLTKQGWATINDSAYILTGSTNGEQSTPPELTTLDTYNWSTGTRVDRLVLTDLGKESNGSWAKDTHEPEGLSVYRDPTTKKASLLLGITTGIYIKNTSTHKWFVYRFSNIGLAP